MVLDCLVSTMKVFGTNMNEDIQAFDNWLVDIFKLKELPDSDTRELLQQAWQAAIVYEQNKPIRKYRWDGII
jgi:hypothetical protein